MKLLIITLVLLSEYKCDDGDFVNKLEKIARKVNSLHTTWTATYLARSGDSYRKQHDHFPHSKNLQEALKQPTENMITIKEKRGKASGVVFYSYITLSKVTDFEVCYSKANVRSIPRDIIQNYRHMAGTLKPERNMRLRSFNPVPSNNKALPAEFDARTQWPKCRGIAHIYDQGRCGSCWAVSTTSAFSDRVCIASGAKQNVSRSAQQVLSCCHKCVPHSDRDGCGGGYMTEAYKYMKRTGVTTGGDYKSSEGCQPYKYPKCDHTGRHGYYPSCTEQQRWTSGKCSRRCYNKNYKTPYKKDLIKAKRVYAIESVQDAMRDIYNHGPITTLFEIYDDFFTYEKGVYQHISGDFSGYHGVRIIGWGKEKQVPYWLVANSWNERWGENGTFRILRGKNHVLIEEVMEAVSLTK